MSALRGLMDYSYDLHTESPRLSDRIRCHGRSHPARRLCAQPAALALQATTRTLDIDGRAATVFGLINGNGTPGLILDPGQRFPLDLTNDLTEPTIIHCDGQIPPNAQDGVPDMPMPLLKP